ncbi:hypothetical protein VPH35_136896 [Triticum aestivum]
MDRMALKFATKRDTNSLKVERSDLEQREQGQQLARRGKRKQVGTEGKKLPGFPACQYRTLHHFSELSLHGCLHAFALRKNRDDDGDEDEDGDEEVTGAASAACGTTSHGGEGMAGA